MKKIITASLVCLAFAASAGAAAKYPRDPLAENYNWRERAANGDEALIGQLDDLFDQALADARRAGDGGSLEVGRTLYQRDAAQRYTPPPPGRYRCNSTQIGGNGLAFIAYPYFLCEIRVERGRRQLVKLTGSQRPFGYIYRGGTSGVFLGSMLLGDDVSVPEYGTSQEHDIIARVDRIERRRWRMTMVQRQFPGQINIVDLDPVR